MSIKKEYRIVMEIPGEQPIASQWIKSTGDKALAAAMDMSKLFPTIGFRIERQMVVNTEIITVGPTQFDSVSQARATATNHPEQGEVS